MNLKDYLYFNRIMQAEFAKELDISIGTLTRILNGLDVKLSLALKIEKATQGQVKCIDLLDKSKSKRARVQKDSSK